MKMDIENQPLPSVIEGLMGLNTQPVQKRQRQRVLSENYLQKTSTLHFSRNADYQICQSDSVFHNGLRDSQDTSLHPRQSRVVKPQNHPKIENRQETKFRQDSDSMKSQQKRKHIPLKSSEGRFSVKIYKDLTSEIVDDKVDARNISDSSIRFCSGNMIRKDEKLSSPVQAKRNWTMTRRSLIRPRAHWDSNWYLISEVANMTTTSDPRLHITECNGSSIPFISEPLSTNLESSPSLISENERGKVSPYNKSKTGRCEQNVSDGGNGVYEVLHDPSSCLDFSRLRGCEIGLTNQTLATQNDQTYGTQTRHLICAADDIFREASQSLSDLASCPTPEPLSPTGSESEEVSRCSPISVLESISKGGVPSTMDCFMNGSTDFYGLGMTVSSDEDNREELMDPIEDNAELSDRSYLVSVLGEACGFGDVSYSKWLSFENPITPLVFQILEEKYITGMSLGQNQKESFCSTVLT